MAAQAAPLLELKSLTIGYRQPVVKNLNLALGRGLFVSLLGANGSGKTTLLRTVSKRLKPLAGQLTLNGQSLAAIRAADLAKVMSVVLTDKAQVPMLRVMEFVALGRYPHSDFFGRLTDQDLKAVERSLIAVKADDLALRFIDELSDGERQKVVLARALAQEPQLMLLDEPTAHLDLKHRLEILAILRGLCRSQNLTVLAAVHDVESAAKVSDLVVALKDGALSAIGPPEAALTPEMVKTLYDCPQANFDGCLGGLEMAAEGQAGRAFVLGGRDSAALLYRFLVKRGFSLATGFFPNSDLDAHVALALGGTVLAINGDQSPDEGALFEAGLKELAQSDLLALGQDQGLFPDLWARLVMEAEKMGLPVLTFGPAGERGPVRQALDRRANARPRAAA
jgi:iron complex transport system ATP-binding protein